MKKAPESQWELAPTVTPTKAESAALAVLAQGQTSAGIVGAQVWPKRVGRGVAVQGGGDYAAQMLLGRMRKKGWCRVAEGDGSSQWEITYAGLRAMGTVAGFRRSR